MNNGGAASSSGDATVVKRRNTTHHSNGVNNLTTDSMPTKNSSSSSLYSSASFMNWTLDDVVHVATHHWMPCLFAFGLLFFMAVEYTLLMVPYSSPPFDLGFVFTRSLHRVLESSPQMNNLFAALNTVFVLMQTSYILWTWLIEGRPRATISALFMFTCRGILGYYSPLNTTNSKTIITNKNYNTHSCFLSLHSKNTQTTSFKSFSSLKDENETNSSPVSIAPEKQDNISNNNDDNDDVGRETNDEDNEKQEIDWKTDEEFKKFMGNPSIEAAIKLEKKRTDRKLKELDIE